MFALLLWIGVGIHAIGTSYYIWKTLRGATKPNRVTWFMWALTALVAYAAAISDGVGLAALPVLLAGLGPLLVFFASFVNKKAHWKLTLFDSLCGVSALAALLLWIVTSNPLLAIIFAIVGELFATIPTLIKSWRFPETETGVSYATASFSMLTGILAAQSSSFSAIAFPLSIIVINAVLIYSVYRNRISALLPF